jgi:hypothetical protein
MMGTTGGNGGVVERLTRSTADMTPHERSEQADTMRQKLVELAAAHNRLVEMVDQQSKAQIGTDSAVGALIPLLQVDGGFQGIDGLHKSIAALEPLTRETWNRLDGVSARESRLTNQAIILRSSFMARLRWLVLGR